MIIKKGYERPAAMVVKCAPVEIICVSGDVSGDPSGEKINYVDGGDIVWED